MAKLTSRKFWICVAAFLASIGTSIAGYHVENEMITVLGMICATVSAAIYAACEAVIDKASAGAPVIADDSEADDETKEKESK